MTRRTPPLGVLLAAVLAGLAFSPVFAAGALLAPVVAVVVGVLLVDELALHRPRLSGLRPVLAAGAGLLALAEVLLRPTLVGVLPTAATGRALLHGATDGWLATLDSTWPVEPTAEQVLFVPLLVLLVAVVGVEVVRRTRAPLLAFAPSLGLLGLSQAYSVARSWPALGIAAGYAATVAVVLVATRRDRTDPAAGSASAIRSRRRAGELARLVLPAVAAAAIGAVALAAADPLARSAYSLKEHHQIPELPASVTNPLDEIAERLASPNQVVFLDRTAAPVDRWPVAVLDTFDGANWTSAARYRPLGSTLPPDPAVAAPVTRHDAVVKIVGLAGPWLPTQQRTRSVSGLEPLVDPASGMVLAVTPTVDLQYRVEWQAPEITGRQLAGAGVGAAAATGTSLGQVPGALVGLAQQAVGRARPSFQAALLLERWLREHYHVATGRALPTGHGYPQIEYFLTTSRRGTSEQFATAYVVLARVLGIPARLVVGFRQPGRTDPQGSYVVHNSDVLAWPEVAVAGAGWVPLDPTAGAQGAEHGADRGLAAATAQARKDLPPTGQITPDQDSTGDPPQPPPAQPRRSAVAAWLLLAGGLALALLCWLAGAPVARRVRRRRRRRAVGQAAVVGAWLEARDLLRQHGVPARLGMTVRELAGPAHRILPADGHLEQLAGCVDVALWSGQQVARHTVEHAWSATDAVRRTLAGRPVPARLRAAVEVRSLLPVRR